MAIVQAGCVGAGGEEVKRLAGEERRDLLSLRIEPAEVLLDEKEKRDRRDE